jgi:hypothetical protein
VAAADDEVLARPVFVVGAPRSGTATLGDVLGSHPEAVFVREPRLLWRHGNESGSDLLRPADARPEVRDHIRATFAELVRAGGGRRLVEKSPSNSLRIPFVHEVFPDALFVHIIRDGPDCIAAIRRKWVETPHGANRRQRDRIRRHLREVQWRRAPRHAAELARQLLPRRFAPVVGARQWGPRIPGLDGLVRDLDLLEVCALQWRTCVELACHDGRQLPADRYLEVRLDQLDRDRVAQVAAWCGLDDPAVLARYDALYDDRKIVARADELDPDERRRVAAWIEPTVALLTAAARAG